LLASWSSSVMQARTVLRLISGKPSAPSAADHIASIWF
jgi:hypothetical protein